MYFQSFIAMISEKVGIANKGSIPVHEETAGYTWTDYKTNTQIAKELKINSNFEQITGIQEKLDTICKQNTSQ
jgi:hypothetical protein